jgi:hypothetical protein
MNAILEHYFEAIPVNDTIGLPLEFSIRHGKTEPDGL